MDRVEVPEQVISSQGRVRTTIRVDAYLKELVEVQIRKVGIPSLCFLTENLWRSWLTGEMTLIPRARPVTVNMKVYYGVTRPRRYPKPGPKEVHLWPPDCPQADEFSKSSREVGCLKTRDWVPLGKCWDCFCSKEEV